LPKVDPKPSVERTAEEGSVGFSQNPMRQTVVKRHRRI
jgi:hypothetical protein